VQERVLVAGEPVAAQLVPRRDAPHVGLHAEVLHQQLLRLERPGHAHAGRQQLHPRPVGAFATGVQQVHAPQQTVDIQALGLGRLHDRLVVQGDVVEDVLRRIAVHAPQAVAHDVPDLVPVRRVVGDNGGVGAGEQR
jgi:hypothetical protein